MSDPFFEVCTVAMSYRPWRWNHEPGVARLPNGDLMAVWGVTGREPDPNMLAGSFSKDCGRTWSYPVLLASDPVLQSMDPTLLVAGDKVILQYTLQALAPKQPGDKHRRYHGAQRVQRVSTDNGQTWSALTTMPIARKAVGNCHEGIVLRDGTLVWPYYWEKRIEAGEEPIESDMTAAAGVMRSTDGGETWTAGGDTQLDGTAEEPSVVELSNGDLYMLVRTRKGCQYEARSHDKGLSWSPLAPSALVSPNAPAALYRLSWQPSKVIVVWNNTDRPFAHRYPLDVAISDDDCRTWSHSMTISSPGCQVSYPGITVADDGHIVVVYQQWHNTRYTDRMEYTDITADIKCARFNEEWLRVGDFVSPRT